MLDRVDAELDGTSDDLRALCMRGDAPTALVRLVDEDAQLLVAELRSGVQVLGRVRHAAGLQEQLDDVGTLPQDAPHRPTTAVDPVRHVAAGECSGAHPLVGEDVPVGVSARL